MALDKLTLLDETVINSTATTAATTVVNNSAQTNYISYPVAVGNPLTNGWRVYFDGAAVAPVDGVSGTTTITVTQNTVSPLNSTGDFRLTKTSGASRQGEGFSTDFTIANRHLGKVLQASFDYEVISGTLATDDIRFYIIQDPGGTNTVIEPVNVSLQGSAAPTIGNPTIRLRHIASFQTSISVTSYRLCIHIATTTNSLQIIDFNGFRVWEPTQSIGAVITDWTNYTPITNGITTSSSSFQWRRVGGSVEITGSFTFSSVVSATFQLPLPSGLTISSTITRKTLFGKLHLGRATADGTNPQWFLIGNGGNSFLTLALQSSNTASTLSDYPSNGTGAASGDIFTMFASVPIAGWGSSVAMSSDTGDSRVIACIYNSGTNNSLSNTSTPIRYTNRILDTHNAYNTSTGIFTAPVSGIYEISFLCYNVDTGGEVGVAIYKGPNLYAQIGTIQANSNSGGGTGIVQSNAGDQLSIRATSTAYIYGYANFAVRYVSAGSQVIAASEIVAAAATKESGSWSNATIVTWTNKDFDTHNALNISTGEFTCPITGKYLVTTALQPSQYMGFNSQQQTGISFRKNGTEFAKISNYWNGANTTWAMGEKGSYMFDCVAGDKLSIYGIASWTVESGKFSHVTFQRI